MSEDKLPRADNLYELASVRCPNCGADGGRQTPRSIDQAAEHFRLCQCRTCKVAAPAKHWIVWPA